MEGSEEFWGWGVSSPEGCEGLLGREALEGSLGILKKLEEL